MGRGQGRGVFALDWICARKCGGDEDDEEPRSIGAERVKERNEWLEPSSFLFLFFITSFCYFLFRWSHTLVSLWRGECCSTATGTEQQM